MSPHDRDVYIKRKREAKAEREKMARTMGIEYFLEMVRLHTFCLEYGLIRL